MNNKTIIDFPTLFVNEGLRKIFRENLYIIFMDSLRTFAYNVTWSRLKKKCEVKADNC